MIATALFALLTTVMTAMTAQEPPVTRSRSFSIRVDAPERPASQALWASRDNGKTWRPAVKLSVKSSWGTWSDGVIRCSVQVPTDGEWQFHTQLGDAVGNTSPVPKDGTAAPTKMHIHVQAGGSLEWRSPRGSISWSAGDRVTLRWSGDEADLRDRTGELAYSLSGGRDWMVITRGLSPTGSYEWVVPNVNTTKMQLRIRGLTLAGRETEALSDAIQVKATDRPDLVLARSLYDRARILAAQGRVTEARLKYEEALAAWGNFSEVHNDLGHLHAKTRDYVRALEHFLTARRICPSDPRAYVNAASMEIGLGLLDDAIADLRDAVALGLEKDERVAILAGEMLWRIAATSPNNLRKNEACTLIISIRLASRATRERARRWLAESGS